MTAKTVFISHRRDAVGKLFARVLEEKLTSKGYDVFLDVDCINAGYWADQLLTEIPRRAHFLLLLTPNALDRCADADDWVRREFELARTHKRNIVPIREESVDIAELKQTCPDCMHAVFDLQVADVRHGSFDADVARLMQDFIAEHQAPKEKQPATPPTTIKVDISHIDKPGADRPAQGAGN